jgi:hypothetical protein
LVLCGWVGGGGGGAQRPVWRVNEPKRQVLAAHCLVVQPKSNIGQVSRAHSPATSIPNL